MKNRDKSKSGAKEPGTLAPGKQAKIRGKPDVLYQDVQLDLLYGDMDIFKREYTLVYSELCYSIWKGTSEAVTSNIYVRKELVEELGLKEVEEANLWNKR